jgi:sucrose phosphorylase
VQSLLSLLRFRNRHAAFNGRFTVVPAPPGTLALHWSHGEEFARLDVDLAAMRAAVVCSGEGVSTWPW